MEPKRASARQAGAENLRQIGVCPAIVSQLQDLRNCQAAVGNSISRVIWDHGAVSARDGATAVRIFGAHAKRFVFLAAGCRPDLQRANYLPNGSLGSRFRRGNARAVAPAALFGVRSELEG